jgi:hypothetical protein
MNCAALRTVLFITSSLAFASAVAAGNKSLCMGAWCLLAPPVKVAQKQLGFLKLDRSARDIGLFGESSKCRYDVAADSSFVYDTYSEGDFRNRLKEIGFFRGRLCQTALASDLSNALPSGYRTIKLGMPHTEVIRVLGKPTDTSSKNPPFGTKKIGTERYIYDVNDETILILIDANVVTGIQLSSADW